MFALKKITVVVCSLVLLAHSLSAAQTKEEFFSKFKWTKGPAKANLKSIAEIQVPEGYMSTDGDGARKMLEAMGNLTNGREVGMLMPTSMVWFVVFRFDDSGYVKDDDKDKLNADKMLKTFKEGTEQSNKEREKRGIPAIHITGWEQAPRYNEQTHNLEWAIKGESEGEPIVNWNTRLLGRRGVMEVKLVVDPVKLRETMPAYEKLIADFSYKSGERYAEFKQGDKIAQYGLAGLVLGGAAVGAAKLGLFSGLLLFLKKIWKLVIVAVVAVAGFFKRLIFGKDRNNPGA